MAQGDSVRLSHLAAMFSVWGGLLGWCWLADRIGCAGSALFLVPLWAVLMLAGSELPLLRRTSFVRHYLQPAGWLARWLKRRLWLLTWQGAKALLLALILLVSALSFDAAQWMLLCGDILLVGTLLFLADWVLEGELNPSCEGTLTRHWVHRVNVVLLWVALVAVMFFTAHEDYRGMAWEDAAELSALEVKVGCDALAVLARISAVGGALQWWAAENLFGVLGDPGGILMAWTLFLAAFGVSFLVAWSYSRALIGVLARPFGSRFVDSGGGA